MFGSFETGGRLFDVDNVVLSFFAAFVTRERKADI